MGGAPKITNRDCVLSDAGIVLGLFGAGARAEDQGRPEARLGHGAITLAIGSDTQQDVD